jgi:hypothetical protein
MQDVGSLVAYENWPMEWDMTLSIDIFDKLD